MDQTQKEALRQVLLMLHEHGYEAYVVGGAARDIWHGRVPKDFDIMILGSADIDSVVEALGLCTGRVEPFGDGTSMLPIDEAPAANKERLDFVVKAVHMGIEFDILKYTEDYDTPQQAVENFDLSINMAWLDSDMQVKLHPEYPTNGGKVKLLPRIDFPLDRVPYMQSKYPNYLYPTEAEIQEFLYRRETKGA